MAKKVPANNEDKKRSYYKYYLQDCAAGDPERHKLIDAGPGDPANALHIDNRNDLFLPGDLPGEFGWFQMSDGTGLIANLFPRRGRRHVRLVVCLASHSPSALRLLG